MFLCKILESNERNRIMASIEDIIIQVMIGGVIAILVFRLDWKRRRDAQNTHKKIIKMNLGEINKIIEFVTFHTSIMDEDTDGTSLKLNNHMEKYHTRIEALIQNIQTQHAHCEKLNSEEEKIIKAAVKSANWILDTYYRKDIPMLQRERIWAESHDSLHNHAKIIIQTYNNF